MKQPERVGPYQLFMLMLSSLALGMLAADLLVHDEELTTLLQGLDFGICMIFLFDFAYCFATADRKLRYLKWGWIDLVSSIPAVDALRVGRTLRVVRILRLFRGVRSARDLLQFVARRRADTAMLTITMLGILVFFLGCIGVLLFERGDPSASIKTAGDAMWWCAASMSPLAAPGIAPITPEGRMVAVGVALFGVALFGTVTASVTSWITTTGSRTAGTP